MNRLLGTAVLLVVVIAALPAVAHLAQAAVPALVSVIVFLGVARLLWPSRRRRR